MPIRSLLSGGRLALAASLASAAPLASALTVDFGDVNLSTPPAQSGFGGVYYNGSDGAGGFSSGGASFGNNYNADWDSWDGFAYSTATDTSTVGYTNQYSAYALGGNTGAYAVAFAGYATPATIAFATDIAPISVDLTNVTYAALDMLDGSAFSKKFGGASGDDSDWFSVTLTSYDAGHAEIGSVTFYLADFRFADNSLDYVVSDWTNVDLAGLGSGVRSIELSWDSSDVGSFGINTPLYVALDNLAYSAIPEPASASALAGAALLGLVALRRRRVARA